MKGRVTKILKVANVAGAAIMIAFGFLLAYQPLIEIAQPPGSDAFRLIQFHFLLTGAFALAGLAKNLRAAIAGFALLLLGVNAWLAYLAVTSSDPKLLWPVVFAVMSALTLAFLLANDVPLAEDGGALEEPEHVDAKEDGLIPASFGVAASGSQLRGALVSLGAIALVIGLTAALFFFGAIYIQLLKAAIFDGSSVSFARVMANLRAGAGDDVVARVVITIVVSVVVYGGVFLIEIFINYLMKSRQSALGVNSERDLTHEERVYAHQSILSLADYLDGRKYDGAWPALYAFGVVGVIASFLAVPAGLFWVETIIDSQLEAARADGALLYHGAIYAGAAIGGFFAGALLFWSLYQYLGARFPVFGEYLFARAGWNSANGRPRTPYELLWVLVRHIRGGLLEKEKPFDPAAFLYSAFRERESIIYKATALSLALAAILFAADLARYEFVDDRGVGYSRYFQFTSRRVEFSDLDRVELRCALYSPDKKGNVNLGVDYILVKDGAFRIDILDKTEAPAERMASLEELDAKLSAAGVPIVRAKSAGLLQGNRSSFTADCRKEIEARYSAEIAPRLINLLRVDRFADPQN